MPSKDLPDYPKETEGSILARRVRTKANSLTDEERKALFREAIEIINHIENE